MAHGRFKRPMKEADVETICRALLAYCLLHYRGDENIKSFIWDLITPSEDGTTKTLTNHSGEVDLAEVWVQMPEQSLFAVELFDHSHPSIHSSLHPSIHPSTQASQRQSLGGGKGRRGSHQPSLCRSRVQTFLPTATLTTSYKRTATRDT